jgi:hypothetical protein
MTSPDIPLAGIYNYRLLAFVRAHRGARLLRGAGPYRQNLHIYWPKFAA